MIKIEDPADCCGCTACASVCVHDAIVMKPDALGFLYPKVDDSKCINCGLCEKVCSFNDHYDISLNLSVPDAYAARHKDIHEVETSRSGAAFIAVSDWILKQGGVVYGVGYTDHFRVVHKRATTKEARDEFKGSKYVQSDLGDVFHQVKNDLKDGMIVLFSGTPCQTSGLNSYIGKRLRENLYLVDIVCHGVPSPYIWRDYLAYLEKKHGEKITWVNFRDKRTFGWSAHREKYQFESKKEYKISNTYTYLFHKHIMLRHSCTRCHFCNITRPSDITLADYWGWENTNKNINKDNKGVSLVFVNTEKGRRLFDTVKSTLDYIPAKLQDCMQLNLQHPSVSSTLSEQFEIDYKRKGFKYIIYKYGNVGLQYKFQYYSKKITRKIRLIYGKF